MPRMTQVLYFPAFVRGFYNSEDDIDWYEFNPANSGRVDLVTLVKGSSSVRKTVSLFVIHEDKTILNRCSAFDELRLSFACIGGSKW